MTCRHRTLLLALALAAAPPRSFAAAPADAYGDPLPPGALARMGLLRLRHGGEVLCAAFSPDGKTLATASHSGSNVQIRLWDRATGKEHRRISGPENAAARLAFSPDGKVLVCLGGGTLFCWHAATGQRLRRFIKDPAGVSDFAFAPDGRILATGHDKGGKTEDREIHLWDTANGRELRRLSGHTSAAHALAFSADGKRLMSASSRSRTIELFVWDTRSWTALHRLSVEDQLAAFSPDGRTTALGQDSRIRLWDLESAKVRVRLDLGDADARCLISPDGKLLATGSRAKELRLWDVAAGKELHRFRGPRRRGAPLAYSRDGRFLAAEEMGGEVRFWDVRTGREARPVGGHRDPVSCLAFSPDGKTILSGSDDGTVRVWQTKTGKELRRFEGHRTAVTALALSPGGRTVATGDEEGSVLLWDAATTRELRRLRLAGGRVESLVFAPDGRSLTGTASEGDVRVWDAATGKLLRQFRVRRQQFSKSALSPDGAVLAYTGWTPQPDRRAGVIQFRGLVPGLAPPAIRGAEDYESLAFTPDGKFLAAKAGHYGGQARRAEWNVRVWETTSGKEVLVFRLDDLGAVAFSPDGRTLFVGGGRWRESAWGCRAWDLPMGKPLGDFAENLGPVEALAVSRDSARVATGGFDGTILVWDATRLPRPAVAVPEQLAGPWADLAGADAARAYRSLWALTSDPRRAVAFVRRHLRPVPRPDPKRLHRLTAALDSDSFAEREKAAAELEGQGELAEGALRAVLADPPSLEARRRAERVLARLTPPSGERLRALRAVVVLEHIGTPEARKLLEELAGGAPEARLTWEARAALRRLAAKP